MPAWPISEQSARANADRCYNQKKDAVEKDSQDGLSAEQILQKDTIQRFKYGYLFNRKEFRVAIDKIACHSQQGIRYDSSICLLRWRDGKKQEEHFNHRTKIWTRVNFGKDNLN